MGILISLYAGIALAQAVATVSQQSAFFCLLGEYDAKKGEMLSKPIPLNFLLTGHPLDGDRTAPIKTYDPAKLLKSQSFNLFTKKLKPGSKGYIVTTQNLSASGYMLTMSPKKDGHGRFTAVLGDFAEQSDNNHRYVGECLGPVAPIDEAIFDAESKQ